LSKERVLQDKESGAKAAAPGPRRLEDITPPQILAGLKTGVLGQDDALRFVSVAIYKHTTGKVSGNIILIGNSGTGKTTLMNNIQRLYHEVPEYNPFRAMAILNANLLVDSDRLEFRPDRLLNAVEQRARSVMGRVPTSAELKATMERATVCVDEIDKMSSILGGKPNPIGVALQQGLLTLMEGAIIPIRTHAVVDGEENPLSVIYHNKYYEAQKYLTLTKHVYNSMVHVISKRTWDKLTPDQQKIVKEESKKAGDFFRKAIVDEEKSLLGELKAKGMDVVEQVDLAKFRQAMGPAYERIGAYAGEENVKKFMKMVQETK